MLLTQSGFFVSKRTLMEIFPSGRPDLLLVGLCRYMVWTTLRLSHQSLVCLTSTWHTLMANSMKIFIWSSCHTMRRLIEDAMSSNSTKLFTVSSKWGKKWYNSLCHSLADIGFKKTEADPAVFFIHAGNHVVILAIHVDNSTMTGSSVTLQNEYKVCINTKFQLTNLGPILWLLGLTITLDRASCTLSLSQHSYIDTLLHHFNLKDCKPLTQPLACPILKGPMSNYGGGESSNEGCSIS